MGLKNAVANALSFASLAGLARAKGARSESEKDEEEDKKKDDAKAESEEEDAKAEDDKPEDKDDEKKESKAEGKDDDDSDDDEEKEKAKADAGERQRCKAIVAHGVKMSVAAGGDLAPVIDACMLAFDTDVSAEAAIASMSARADVAATLPRKAAGQALETRMGAEPVPIAKPEAGKVDASDPKAIALTVIAAAKKARGEA